MAAILLAVAALSGLGGELLFAGLLAPLAIALATRRTGRAGWAAVRTMVVAFALLLALWLLVMSDDLDGTSHMLHRLLWAAALVQLGCATYLVLWGALRARVEWLVPGATLVAAALVAGSLVAPLSAPLYRAVPVASDLKMRSALHQQGPFSSLSVDARHPTGSRTFSNAPTGGFTFVASVGHGSGIGGPHE